MQHSNAFNTLAHWVSNESWISLCHQKSLWRNMASQWTTYRTLRAENWVVPLVPAFCWAMPDFQALVRISYSWTNDGTTNIYLDISGYQYISIKIWWFPEIGVPPNHQFYIIGFSIINQPFLDTPVYLDMIYLPSLDPIRQSPAWHSRGPAQHGGGACGAKGRRVQGQTLRNGAQHKPCHHLGRWNLKDEKSDENLLWLYTYIYIHIQYTHVVCPSVVKSIYIYILHNSKYQFLVAKWFADFVTAR